MSRVIVSVATGPRFCGGMRRLKEKLLALSEPATLGFWYDDFPPGPTHNEIPYGFKVSAIETVLARSHRPNDNRILWLDSSVVPIAPLDPVWEHIEREGYWFSQNYTHTVADWCCEEARQAMELDPEHAKRIPLVIATAFGLNFKKDVARGFFNIWKRFRDAGAFNGPVTTHRHDQTVASVAAYSMNMLLTQPPKFIVEDFQAPTEETVFTICR